MSCIIHVKRTDNHDFFPCFASLFAEGAEEKAKKEAEENAHQGTDEKKTDEKDEKKPAEDATAAKTENHKEPNSVENKSADSNKNHINGTRQTGVNKHETSQGKNAARTDTGMDSHHPVEEKQHVQNGEFASSIEM